MNLLSCEMAFLDHIVFFSNYVKIFTWDFNIVIFFNSTQAACSLLAFGPPC